MKIVFIFSLLVITVLPVFSQTLTGFMDIPFGTNYSETKRLLLKKEGASLDTKYSTHDILIVDGIMFAGRRTNFVRGEFFNDKLHLVIVFYRPKLKPYVIELYNTIKSELQDKYGEPNAEIKDFKYPYEEGKGDEVFAIQGGYAKYQTLWHFNRDDDFKNSILLEIDENLSIELSYYDGKLGKAFSEWQKKNKSKDY